MKKAQKFPFALFKLNMNRDKGYNSMDIWRKKDSILIYQTFLFKMTQKYIAVLDCILPPLPYFAKQLESSSVEQQNPSSIGHQGGQIEFTRYFVIILNLVRKLYP